MDYEVSIRLKGIDNATPTFKDVTSAIIEMRRGNEVARRSFNELYKEIREQQKIIRVLKEEASGAGLTFEAFKDTLGKFGSVMGGLNGIMMQWNVMQTRLSAAQIALNQAQKDYNDAVERFGPNSEQARRALERLHEAQRKMNQAQTETIFQMTTLGVNAITLVPKFMELYKSLSALIAVKRVAAATSAQLAAAQAASAAAGLASVPGHLAAAGGIAAVGAAAATASKPLAIFKALLGPPGWALLAGAAMAVTTFFATVSSQSVAAEKSLASFHGTASETFKNVASGAEIMASSVSTSFDKMRQTIKISGQEFASYADYVASIVYDAYMKVQEINAKMRLDFERSVPWYAGRYGLEAQLAAQGRWSELLRMQRAGGVGGWAGYSVEEVKNYGLPIPLAWYSSLGQLRQYYYGKTELTYEELLRSPRHALRAQIDFLRMTIPQIEERYRRGGPPKLQAYREELLAEYREELQKLERALAELEAAHLEKIKQLEREKRYREAVERVASAFGTPAGIAFLSRFFGRTVTAADLPTTPADWRALAAKFVTINVHGDINVEGGIEELLEAIEKKAYISGGE